MHEYRSCEIGIALHFTTISYEMHFSARLHMSEDSEAAYIFCGQLCMTHQFAYLGWPVNVAGTTCAFHDVQ